MSTAWVSCWRARRLGEGHPCVSDQSFTWYRRIQGCAMQTSSEAMGQHHKPLGNKPDELISNIPPRQPSKQWQQYASSINGSCCPWPTATHCLQRAESITTGGASAWVRWVSMVLVRQGRVAAQLKEGGPPWDQPSHRITQCQILWLKNDVPYSYGAWTVSLVSGWVAVKWFCDICCVGLRGLNVVLTPKFLSPWLWIICSNHITLSTLDNDAGTNGPAWTFADSAPKFLAAVFSRSRPWWSSRSRRRNIVGVVKRTNAVSTNNWIAFRWGTLVETNQKKIEGTLLIYC